MSDPPPSLHQRLQSTTRAAHLRVEQAFDLAVMTRSVDDYQQSLIVLETSLSAALRALGKVEWSTWRPDLAGLSARHDWLVEDLGALGAPTGRMSGELKLGSEGQGLGCLYVLEGSALGGLVIYKAVHRALGVTPEKGGRYFQGLGRSTVGDWKTFLAALNVIPAMSWRGNEAKVGALRTFDLIETALHRDRGMFHDSVQSKGGVAPPGWAG